MQDARSLTAFVNLASRPKAESLRCSPERGVVFVPDSIADGQNQKTKFQNGCATRAAGILSLADGAAGAKT